MAFERLTIDAILWTMHRPASGSVKGIEVVRTQGWLRIPGRVKNTLRRFSLESIPKRERLSFEFSAFSAIYAIGDVHGCFEELLASHQRIVEDAAALNGATITVLLGDYVDRGPNARAVLDFLCLPAAPMMNRIALCGNHDQEFLQFCRDPVGHLSWLDYGGRETLFSYGIDADRLLMARGGRAALARAVQEAVPERHIAFLESLPIVLQIGPIVFAHAGLRPSVELDSQKERDILWIREPFLSEGPKLPLLVVHGHTVSPEPSFGPRRIGIDTGAYATGRLTTLKIANGSATFL